MSVDISLFSSLFDFFSGLEPSPCVLEVVAADAKPLITIINELKPTEIKPPPEPYGKIIGMTD